MVAVEQRAHARIGLAPWLALFALVATGCGGVSQRDDPQPEAAGSAGTGGLTAPNGSAGTGGSAESGGTGSMTVGGSGDGGYDGPLPVCRCSRRSDAPEAECPRGQGLQVAGVIGPDGGSIELGAEQGTAAGVPFALQFPMDAYATETTVVLTEMEEPPPEDFVDFSPLYLVAADAEPDGTVALQLPWGNRAGTVGGELSIYFRAHERADWERVPDSYVNAGFMQGSLVGLGFYFAGYPISAESQCP
jgi:hypothetical protein